MDRSLRDLGLRLAARKRQQGAAPAAARRTVRRLTPDVLQVSPMGASSVDELVKRGSPTPENRSAQFSNILNSI